jgi:serine/threonine protein kinase
MGLEGMALLALAEKRLLVGLVLPVARQTLAERYSEKRRVVEDYDLRGRLFQMLLGVYELHFHRIWHRDLSPGNFIFAAQTPNAPFLHRLEQLLVIDLGASKMLEELESYRSLSVVCTPGFGAPEYVGAHDHENAAAGAAGEAYKGSAAGCRGGPHQSALHAQVVSCLWSCEMCVHSWSCECGLVTRSACQTLCGTAGVHIGQSHRRHSAHTSVAHLLSKTYTAARHTQPAEPLCAFSLLCPAYAGDAAGTQPFMPGPPTTWHKADIWSVGAIALYLWFGNHQEWLGKQLYHTPAEVARHVVEHSAAACQANQQRQQQEMLQDAGPDVAVTLAMAPLWLAEAADWVPPQGLLDLLGSCLLADPAQRKTARELLALPWFEVERAQMLKRAQGVISPPPSPTAAGAAGAAAAPSPPTSSSWGPALDALLQEWQT